MSEVEKLKIGNTSYDIKDATAAHSLSDIASAGAGVVFFNPAINWNVAGAPTINSNYEISNFSDNNYLYCPNLINNASSSFEIVTAVNMTTASSTSQGIIDSPGTTTRNIRLSTSTTNTVRLRISTDGSQTYDVDITGTTPLTVGTKVWIKATYDSSTGYALFTSTDGSSWTSEGTSNVTTRPYASGTRLMLGDNSATGLALTGVIYLADTLITINGTDTFEPLDNTKTGISTTAASITVDQTFDGTSANAQSGVAVNSAILNAGFLQNTGNSSYSNLGIIGTTNASSSRNQQVAIGYGAATSNSRSVAIGYNAKSGANADCTVIGNETSASSTGGIAIGSKSSVSNGVAIGGKTSNGIVIGCSTNTTCGGKSVCIGSTCTGTQSVVIGSDAGSTASYATGVGWGAHVSANYAIQLGYGTNSTANTFSVGLSSSNNYQLLDSSGHIPAARLTNAVQGALTSSSITLAAADWSTNTQTVTVNGITSSSFIWVSPAAASASAYADAGILCTAQATNSLTFTCDTTPSTDITVTIVFG